MTTKKETTQLNAKEYEKLGREMWVIYETNYTNRKRAYMFTFFRGIIYGFGLFLGGTILVAILLYSLSFFDQVPFAEKLYNAITNPTSTQYTN